MILQLNAGDTVHKRHSEAVHYQIQANIEHNAAMWERWKADGVKGTHSQIMFKMIDVVLFRHG